MGTDHCPFDTAQKLLGKDAFTQIPNGIPGIEERVNLMYTYGVKRGRLDIHRFVDALSTRAAKLFGLFPRKGTIAVGSDADLVDLRPGLSRQRSPPRRSTSTTTTTASKAWRSRAGPSVVTVRGKVQVRDGKFVGERGRGRLLKREPAYF